MPCQRKKGLKCLECDKMSLIDALYVASLMSVCVGGAMAAMFVITEDEKWIKLTALMWCVVLLSTATLLWLNAQ